MEAKVLEQFTKYMEEGTILEGVAFAAKTNAALVSAEKKENGRSINPEGDAVVVSYDKTHVYIPREELEYRPATGSLARFIGESLAFEVTDVDEETGMVTGSRKVIDNAFREKLAIEMKEEGVTKEAVIQTLLRFGAYVTIDGHSTLLRNQDFSTDYTSVRDVHNVGDKVTVKLVEYTEDGNLNIEMAEKYKNQDVSLALEELEVGQPILGTVQNITFLDQGHAVFTRIAPGVDAISPTPENIDLNIGDKVIFMLTQLDVADGKVRGFIIRKSHSEI